MEKPKEKLKKILIILGITGAVYAGCKYLLPLVIPFFAAYGMALLLEPSSAWLSRKLSFRWKGRSVRFPIELIGGAELLLILAALSAGIYFGGQRLLEQAKLLADSLPEMTRQFDRWLTGNCRQVETALHLKKGYVVLLMQDMLRELGEKVKTAAMPYLMVSSVTVFQWIAKAAVILLVVFLVVFLASRMVSLGSITVAALYPILTLADGLIRQTGTVIPDTVVGILWGGMVIFLHRENIKRLLNGTESKFGKKK